VAVRPIGPSALQRRGRRADPFEYAPAAEFTVLLWSSDREQAHGYAERVRAAFAAADLDVGPLTISAGVACDQPPTLELDPLLQRADSALYEAKAAGRDRSVVDGEPQTSLLAR
jgi:diguanylate cyclase (GGDEF)-like protein